jgi:hypothetical protein
MENKSKAGRIEKICFNCAHWQGSVHSIGIDNIKQDECVELDKITKKNDTCDQYSPDPSRFCAICNSEARDDDSCAGIFCNANDTHYASHWDYEWQEIN